MDRKTKKAFDAGRKRLDEMAHGLCLTPVSSIDAYAKIVGEYLGIKFMLDNLSVEKEEDD